MRHKIYDSRDCGLRVARHRVIITSEVNGNEYWTDTVIEVAEPIVEIYLEEIPNVPNAPLNNPPRRSGD